MKLKDKNKKYYSSLNTKDNVRNIIYILLIGIVCIPVGYIAAEVAGILGACLGTGIIFTVRYGIGAMLPWELKKFIEVNRSKEK